MVIDAGVLLKTWMDKARSLLHSPRAIRWGGFALVAGGLLGAAGAMLMVVVTVQNPYGTSSEPGIMVQLSIWSNVSMFVAMLLVAVGLVGLYALVATVRHERVKKLALTGLVIAGLPLVIIPLVLLYIYLFPPDYSYSSGGPALFNVVAFGWLLVRPFGVLLLGVAALWSRGLGRWRLLPMAIGLTMFVSSVFIYSMYRGGPGALGDGISSALLSAAPLLLPDLGWILLGALLPGAKRRELSILAREKQMLEEKNLSLARRLYEEAWGRGNLQVVDELVSPDFFDHHHNRSGIRGFKKSIAGLRETFPDLSFTLEEQSAEGDAVTTRCTMEGTDEGGVLWYPPTGKKAVFGSEFTDLFSDGQLVEHRGESDVIGLLKQLDLPHAEERTAPVPTELNRSPGPSVRGA